MVPMLVHTQPHSLPNHSHTSSPTGAHACSPTHRHTRPLTHPHTHLAKASELALWVPQKFAQ
eukprot:9843579-Alexandrium_andersonii.AAC.1